MQLKTRTIIQERNQYFEKTRRFFKQKNVLEVDTSLLRPHSVTDPYMSAYSVNGINNINSGYLQTSPEYAMKILLSQGSGDIFQLSKMFRAEEKSSIHSPEFTLLEWYRLGFNHFELMQETADFIQSIVGKKTLKIFTYQELFKNILSFDPFVISLYELEELARDRLGDIPADLIFDNYLTLLFSEIIEPTFDPEKITIVHAYPASQASLAKTSSNDGLITADRFEVYLDGIELANGFNELTDWKEQASRFEKDNQQRREMNLPAIALDQEFLKALKVGIPDCAGVALGFDRLLMIQLGVKDISGVIL